MPDRTQDPATPRTRAERADKRRSVRTLVIIAGMILFIMVVFGVLFGAGRLIA